MAAAGVPTYPVDLVSVKLLGLEVVPIVGGPCSCAGCPLSGRSIYDRVMGRCRFLYLDFSLYGI